VEHTEAEMIAGSWCCTLLGLDSTVKSLMSSPAARTMHSTADAAIVRARQACPGEGEAENRPLKMMVS
jgi:hypothetical protein